MWELRLSEAYLDNEITLNSAATLFDGWTVNSEGLYPTAILVTGPEGCHESQM